MKHILVPTDFSPCAIGALKVAAKIARQTGAAISLVHTYAVPVYGFTSGHLMYDGVALTKITEEINDELQRIAEMEEIKDLQVSKLLLADTAIVQMLNHDQLADVDLIVMGTYGTSGVREDLLGSNAEKVIRHAKCPVLCVREEHGDHFNANDMVFASSFFGEVDDHFPKVVQMAELFGARIHLLYVNTPAGFRTTPVIRRQMEQFREKFNLNEATINVYNEYTVEDGVLQFARDTGADMIAMETHGRTGLAHLFLGSITEDVANHTRLPLLSVKIEEPVIDTGVIFPDMR